MKGEKTKRGVTGIIHQGRSECLQGPHSLTVAPPVNLRDQLWVRRERIGLDVDGWRVDVKVSEHTYFPWIRRTRDSLLWW